MEKVIDLNDVFYTKDRKTVLQQINWQVNQGEHWGAAIWLTVPTKAARKGKNKSC